MAKYQFENTIKFARRMDREDPLRSYRNRFLFPKTKGAESIYFVGNSLGLQPKLTKKYVLEELEDWANLGAYGHESARRPWLHYHKLTKKYLADIVGAKQNEVVAMNQLTVNLHLLMVSFYNPSSKRYKIITEAGAFGSDQYAFETQLRFHNIDPAEGLIEIKPREGEYTLRTDDILSSIREHADELALVIFGGVQYYTGQFFELNKITKAGHEAGAIVGFDLAHAVGNVPLQLHADEVDFAVWCTYKYLNSGPGGIAGAYVHEKHGKRFTLNRFAGWWGHAEEERFKMLKGFKPMEGIDGWQVSNVPILQGAAHLASLSIFNDAGMKALRKKSIALTGYLYFLLAAMNPDERFFTILTPEDPNQRGCQLSLYIKRDGKKVFSFLTKKGIMVDWREPNVIRVAPTPLYNTFEEVYRFCEIFQKALK